MPQVVVESRTRACQFNKLKTRKQRRRRRPQQQQLSVPTDSFQELFEISKDNHQHYKTITLIDNEQSTAKVRPHGKLPAANERRLLFWPSALLVCVVLLLAACSAVRCDSGSVSESPDIAVTNEATSESARSELAFEHLNLLAIPEAKLCNKRPLGGPDDTLQMINSVSFANNQIQQIDSNAFVCVGVALRILNLQRNQIKRISPDAFNQLNQLQVLLLDENQLESIPSALAQLRSLRHLNLARNRISLLESRLLAHNTNLISLNLAGNPLNELPANSFEHLAKLKTLTLKSNKFQRIPQFSNCQALLLIDLSHNEISGALDGQLAGQGNLIDLYLGHNQLQHLSANAFLGLHRLQVLELHHNKLLSVDPLAFGPLSASLRELNIAHNGQLGSLPAEGLQRLVSLKAFGNANLRDLPHFRSAKSLALTYAYHCCDYASLAAGGASDAPPLQPAPRVGVGGWELLSGWGHSIFSKVPPLLGGSGSGGNQAPEATAELRFEHPNEQQDEQEEEDEIIGAATAAPGARQERRRDNFTELILWPPSVGGGVGQHSQRPEVDSATTTSSSSSSSSTANGVAADAPNGQRGRRQVRTSGSDSTEGGALELVRLIDELVWQVKQIRILHAASRWDEDDESGRHRRPVGGGRQFDEFAEQEAEPMEWQEVEAPSSLGNSLQQRRLLADWRHKLAAPHDDEQRANGAHLNEQSARLRLRVDLVGELVAKQLASGNDGALIARFTRSAAPNNETTAKDSTKQQQQQQRRRQDSGGNAETVRCLPQPNAFAPCQDLFDSWWLRAGIWVVFVSALVGNTLVIVVLSSVRQSSATSALTSIMWLAHSRRHIDVPRFLVINLALADLLMALYLGLLASVDLATLGRFRFYAIQWQYSAGCKLAGSLAVLSSELSVFILAIITLERNYAITNAVHLNRRLSLHKAALIMLVGYAFALSMALLPLNGISDYRKFSVCLPLDVDTNQGSRLYAIGLLSTNTLSFTLLLSCYLRMYCAIRGSQAWNTNDLRIARRMSILVLTDFLCWMPIIFVALAWLLGYHNLIGAQGMKVLIIFVLPLNSVANPFLYAITTKKFKRDLGILRRRLRRYLCRVTNCLKLTSDKDQQDEDGKHYDNHHHHHHVLRDHNHYHFENNCRHLNNHLQQLQSNLRQTDRGAAEAHNMFPVNFARATKKSRRLARASQRKQVVETRAGGVYDHQRRTAQTAPFNTDKQVTLNRTTCCSCHKLMGPNQVATGGPQMAEAAAQVNLSRNDSNSLIARQGSNGDSQHIVAANDGQPRIVVLDVVEPTLSVVLAPLAFGAGRCVTRKGNGGGSANSLAAGETARGAADSLMATCQMRRPHSADADNTNTAAAAEARDASGHRSLDSARASCTLLAAHSSTTSTTHQPLATQIAGNHHHHLMERAQEAANRSVSACGRADLRKSLRRQQARNRLCSASLNAMIGTPPPPSLSPGGTVTGQSKVVVATTATTRINAGYPTTTTTTANNQCGAHAHKLNRSSERLARSINRLLFEPVAKAWSSIQISLHSSRQTNLDKDEVIATHVDPHTGQESTSSSSNSSLRSSLQLIGGEFRCLESAGKRTPTANTIDAILLMSSPSRQLRRVDERRMSRSCDFITSTCSQQTAATCSTSANEQTTISSTSQVDYDDDQRVLLATIHRMREQKDHSRPPESNKLLLGDSDGSGQSRRRKCTRCRSWSPALLDKLEDCVHQIKNKIPGYTSGGHNKQRVVGQHREMSSHSETPATTQKSQLGTHPMSFKGIGQTQNDNLVKQNEIGGEEDGVDELGVPRCNRTRALGSGRTNKLQQQASAASDALSTRTAATVTTNMSVSFDDSDET